MAPEAQLLLEKRQRVAHGRAGLCLLIGNGKVEELLESHRQGNQIQRIRAEATEGDLILDERPRNAKMFGNEIAGLVHVQTQLLRCNNIAATKLSSYQGADGVKISHLQQNEPHVRRVVVQAGMNVSKRPFMQSLFPVSGGPSSNTWPRCPPHRQQ